MDGKQFPDFDNHDSMSHEQKFEVLPPSRNLGIIIILITLVLSLVWFFLIRNKHPANVVKPVSIVSAISTQKDVPIYFSALGTVTPTYTVTVKSQINGLLMQVLYKEGQLVKKGDLLAQIDPRPYEALLTQYEGNLKRDTALLANAQIDLKRYQTLWKQDSVSQQILATQIALVEQYEGAVKTDQGLIQSTKVNLIYCRITSPIDGRIGLRLVDPGNFVQTSDTTGIAVVNTINPVTVIFTLAEDTISKLLPQVYANKALKVEAYDRQQENLLATGTLITIDNQIDPTTGTVKLRANFDNKDNKLFPNQFVNAKILVKTLSKATLVPTSAIQHTMNGDFVYLINPDQTVMVKPVVIGPVEEDNTVITRGIVPGQSVVIEGADKLMDGAKVVQGDLKNSSSQLKTAANERYMRNIL